VNDGNDDRGDDRGGQGARISDDRRSVTNIALHVHAIAATLSRIAGHLDSAPPDRRRTALLAIVEQSRELRAVLLRNEDLLRVIALHAHFPADPDRGIVRLGVFRRALAAFEGWLFGG